MQIWVVAPGAMHALRGPAARSLGRFRLKEVAENSRYWHFAINRADGQPVGFAEAVDAAAAGQPDAWEVHRTGMLPAFARRLDAALVRLGEQPGLPRRPKLRLLKLPGVNLGVLWIEGPGEDSALVFQKPPGKTGFVLDKLYSWPVFVGLLARNIGALSSGGPMQQLRVEEGAGASAAGPAGASSGQDQSDPAVSPGRVRRRKL